MEKFQVGDKVNFLNATGGGTVKRIIDTRMVEVTIEDGFDIPVLMSDLVLDFRSQPDRRQQIVDNVQKEIQQKQIIEEKENDEARKSALRRFGRNAEDEGIYEVDVIVVWRHITVFRTQTIEMMCVLKRVPVADKVFIFRTFHLTCARV